jgi:NTP pyrophosphatase (non-canonical NTP hydrolase)
MNFSAYQYKALRSAVYPNRGKNIVYPVLGMNGEAGEVAEKVKKILRDKNGVWTKEDQEEIKKEIGDVLWYCAAAAKEFGLNLQDVAEANIDKLKDRLKRNKIHGNGDNR